MSEFAVRVVRIADGAVSHHPNADRLSLIQIGGYTAISAKLEDGSHRYKPGDYVVYVPEGAIVPQYLLHRGFWDETKSRGILAGANGDRVKALKLRGIFSQGILFPTRDPDFFEKEVLIDGPYMVPIYAQEGENVAAALGITKWEPPIPTSMAGEVLYLPQGPVSFDFESIQRLTDLFEDGEPVSVTEKLHGTCFQVGYVPGMANPECFMGGDVYVASKGLGAKHLAFKDNAANDGNIYVRTLRRMMEHPSFEAGLKAVSRMFEGRPIRLFGEVFGGNIQDLGYGLKAPEVRFFDVRAGDEFLPPPLVKFVLDNLYLDSVPVLYEGPFDRVVLEGLRDGKDTITGAHMREGIVIRSFTGEKHAVHGRKIGKWVSPDYLLRKGGTELQ